MFTLSAKKFAYLKTPSTTRFAATANATHRLADGPDRPRARSTAIAARKLNAIDPSISHVKAPPPFA